MKNYLGIEVPTVDPMCRKPIASPMEPLKTGKKRAHISSKGLTHKRVEFSLWMVFTGKKRMGYYSGGEGGD